MNIFKQILIFLSYLSTVFCLVGWGNFWNNVYFYNLFFIYFFNFICVSVFNFKASRKIF